MTHRRLGALLVFSLYALPAARADHLEFTEIFLDSPCESEDWACKGSAFWAPPPDLTIECEDPDAIDPDDPCTLYPNEQKPQEFGGYVMLTGTASESSGGLFSTGDGDWTDIKITAVVELRDGDLGQPGSGISIVFLGEEQDGEHGHGEEGEEGGHGEEGEEGEHGEEGEEGADHHAGGTGDGLGATGLGETPMMAFTFTNEGAGFAWSHDGFHGDQIHLDVGPIAIDEAFPIHNGQAHLAAPNRWQIEIRLHGCHVEMSVKNDDAGFPQTTLIDHTIDDPAFRVIHGQIGVTAATGATGQNHLLHFLKSEEIPPLQDLDCPQFVEATRYTAALDGAQVVEPTGSTATGTADLHLERTDAGPRLEYTLELAGLDLDGLQTPDNDQDDVTAIHIHSGAVGHNGPHVLNVFGAPSHDDADLVVDVANARVRGVWDDSDAKVNEANPSHGSSIALSDALTTLFAGEIYFQIHTKAVTSGEIRGQILPVIDEPKFFRGDPNDDGKSDIADAVTLLGFLFSGGDTPECMDSADTNNDGEVNIADSVGLLNYLFGSGSAPADPGPPSHDAECDHDPSEPSDSLDCHEYVSCHAET